MRLSTATLALLAVSTCALAGDPSTKGAEHRAERMERLATLLDLDDVQKTQVQAIFDEQHQKRAALRAEANASGAQPTREQKHQRHEELRHETTEKLRTVLTEAQMKKFEALGAEHRGHRHGGLQGDQK